MAGMDIDVHSDDKSIALGGLYKTQYNIMFIEDIARISHEVNMAYCASMGDTTQTSWDDAPQWQKDSALAGVRFHLANPDASPSASHESWMKQKEAEGWRYGAVKNPETKEHPCFVPYDQLPAEQRAKDYLFSQVVASLKPFITHPLGGDGALMSN